MKFEGWAFKYLWRDENPVKGLLEMSKFNLGLVLDIRKFKLSRLLMLLTFFLTWGISFASEKKRRGSG